LDDFRAFLKTGRPPLGTVLVNWERSQTPELVRIDSLELLHRGILFGETVKQGPDSAMVGTVIAKDDFYDLVPHAAVHTLESSGDWTTVNRSSETRLYHIPGAELKPLSDFMHEEHIVYKDWLGRIVDMEEEVTIQLPNNSVVVVSDTTAVKVLPQDDITEPKGFTQVSDLVITTKSNIKTGRWISGAYDPSVKAVGQVVEVRPKTLFVTWIGRRLDTSGVRNLPPLALNLDEIDGGDLRIIGSASRSHRRSARVFTLYQRVKFVDLNKAAAKYSGTHVVGSQQNRFQPIPQSAATLGYVLNIFNIIAFSTVLTVHWQDNSITKQSCTELHPHLELEDAAEFFPGQIVLPKESSEDMGYMWQPSRIGVVQSVSAKERMALVLWKPNTACQFIIETDVTDTKIRAHLDGGSKTGFPILPAPQGSGYFEDIPVFDIVPAPGLNRSLGDIVLLNEDSADKCNGQSLNPELQSRKSTSTTRFDWVGRVAERKLDGTLVVIREVDDTPEKTVPPETALLGVAVEDDDWDSQSEGSTDDEDSDVDMDDETSVPIDEWVENEVGERMELDHLDDGEWSTEDEYESPGDETQNEAMKENIEEEPSPSKEPEQHDSISEENGSLALRNHPVMDSAVPHYEVLDSEPPADHHFISSVSSNSSPQRLKRIRKEHAILTGSLPENVYVRSWESRMDLFRVILIGPSDTPYEYAPFLFDFVFPENFPYSPPKAFFHSWTSGEGSVNPNLYEDGKVCLSLLNT
jgi:ubiquitin-conjugating enzyme E2 O